MKKSEQIVFFLLLAVFALLFVLKWPVLQKETRQEDGKKGFSAVFLNVGQGDATLLSFENGQHMLVDCGKDARVLEGLGRQMPFYQHTLDYLVVTHPDLDHYGGCIDVLKRFDVKTILLNGLEKKEELPWISFRESLADEINTGAKEIVVHEPMTMEIGSSTIRFLYPDHELVQNPNVPNAKKETEDNDASIVMKVSYGESDMLLTGDAEEPLELFLLEKYNEELDVEVLKVGHHGSNSSSIEPFLDSVSPDIAVISVGKENRYGHPTLRVLRRLERLGATIYRTDTDGDVSLDFTER